MVVHEITFTTDINKATSLTTKHFLAEFGKTFTVLHNAISSTAPHTGDVKPPTKEEDAYRPLRVHHYSSYSTKPKASSELSLTLDQLPPAKGTCICA